MSSRCVSIDWFCQRHHELELTAVKTLDRTKIKRPFRAVHTDATAKNTPGRA